MKETQLKPGLRADLNGILRNGVFDMYTHSILLSYRGSKAHGTYIPNSNPNGIDDIDVMGIVIPPKEYLLGIKVFEQYEAFIGEWDVLVYDFRKFVRLLIKSNPNVMNLLFTPKHLTIRETPLGEKLRANRALFAHKGIYASFCGYSKAQLHKMTAQAYQGYMGDKRKQLVDKYGFDTKNAQHLIRLLRQGIEFLGSVLI